MHWAHNDHMSDAIQHRPSEQPMQSGGWSYGLMGMPLAFVALPLYVHAPHYYAQTLGVSLASLGAALLIARALDAITDPWLGRITDRWFDQSPNKVLRRMWWGVFALLLGVLALWFPPQPMLEWGATWLTASITLTSLGYSQLTIAHQAWGSRISHTPVQRSRTMAWREGWALVGVVSASVMPSLLDWAAWSFAFAALILVGMWAWYRSAANSVWSFGPPVSHDDQASTPSDLSQRSLTEVAFASMPWRDQDFRRLMGVFVISGMASALPATLVLFFIDQVLQLPDWTGGFLALYFASAAIGMPLWPRAVKRWGLERSWALGMLLAVLSFASASTLGAGDASLYALICVGSGMALGADLAIPSALLAGLARRGSDQEQSGIYFGWWNLATKLNLALAAGLGLPLLATWGYSPQTPSEEGLQALTMAYGVLPCLLKLTALALLKYWLWPTQAYNTQRRTKP